MAYIFGVNFNFWKEEEFEQGLVQDTIKVTCDDNTRLIINPSSYNVSTYCQVGAEGKMDITVSVTDKYITDVKLLNRYNDKADVTSLALGYGINLNCENGSLHMTVDTDNETNVLSFGEEIASGLYADVYVQFIFRGATVDYNYSETLENCTSNIETNKIAKGTNDLVLTVADGFVFNSTPTLAMNGTVYNFTVSGNKQTATLNIDVNADVSVNAVAEKITIYYDYSETLENCTSNITANKIAEGIQNIVLTSNNGYEFGNGAVLTMNGTEYSFVISDDKLTASFTDTVNGNINVVATATKTIEKTSSFCNLYLVTEKELQELSKARFMNNIDYGSFITTLYKTPFPIDETLLSPVKEPIILGNYDTRVKTTPFLTYKSEVDGGTITVNEKYHNVYDYLNTECILHLPHFNKMFLNTEYVINQTLTIKYIIDFYTGNVTVNVYSTFIDDVIETQTQQITENIPFIQKQNNNVVGTLSNINKNNIKTAFIEIVRNIPYDNENIFGKETIDYGVIGDYHGFIKCQNVMLETSATNEEKEEIASLLKGGIFI